MKKQVNLTQSDLYNVIKESVKNVILEFGTDPGKKGDENRTKMAKAAKRAVKRGDSSVYKNAYDSIIKGGGNKEALRDFQSKYENEVEESRNLKEYTEFDKMKMYGQDVDYDEDFENLEDSENLEEYNDIDLQNIYGRPSYDEDFEDVGFNQQPSNVVTGEGRKPVKVTESQLKAIIRESVMRILAEAEIDPRSWDAVARRYDQTDPQKAAYARQRGVQSWNRQYGGDARMNNDGSIEDTGEIHPVPYRDSEVNAPFSMSRFQSNVVSNEPKYSGLGRTKYTPNTNGTFDLEHNDYTKLSKNGMEREFDGTRAANENPTKVNYQQGVPLGNYSKRFNVASQMKTGNGVYDKSKGGWQ